MNTPSSITAFMIEIWQNKLCLYNIIIMCKSAKLGTKLGTKSCETK